MTLLLGIYPREIIEMKKRSVSEDFHSSVRSVKGKMEH